MTSSKKIFDGSAASDILQGMNPATAPAPASAPAPAPAPASASVSPMDAKVEAETVQRLRQQLEELRARVAVGTRKAKKLKEDKVEPRTRKVALKIRPSLYDGVDKLAEIQGISVNAVMEAALTEYVQKHGNQLKGGN